MKADELIRQTRKGAVSWARSRFKQCFHVVGFPDLVAIGDAVRPPDSSLERLQPRGRSKPAISIVQEESFMSNVGTGVVKWFNDSKGFGFITPEGGGEDLFAHFKEIQGTGFKTLKEGQRVQFIAQRGQKGMQATQIKPL
jgi:CspA family cold shock protein